MYFYIKCSNMQCMQLNDMDTYTLQNAIVIFPYSVFLNSTYFQVGTHTHGFKALGVVLSYPSLNLVKPHTSHFSMNQYVALTVSVQQRAKEDFQYIMNPNSEPLIRQCLSDNDQIKLFGELVCSHTPKQILFLKVRGEKKTMVKACFMRRVL